MHQLRPAQAENVENLLWVIFFAILVVGYYTVKWIRQRRRFSKPHPWVDKPCPDFALSLVMGGEISSGDFTDRILVIQPWKSLDALEVYYEKWEKLRDKDGVAIYYLAQNNLPPLVGQDEGGWEEFLKRHHINADPSVILSDDRFRWCDNFWIQEDGDDLCPGLVRLGPRTEKTALVVDQKGIVRAVPRPFAAVADTELVQELSHA